jgi:hypothetical protein
MSTKTSTSPRLLKHLINFASYLRFVSFNISFHYTARQGYQSMEEFYHVLQTGFVYLQVLNKCKNKTGDELFCNYHGDVWFQLQTSADDDAQLVGDESSTTETDCNQTQLTNSKFQDAREL